MGGQTSSMLVFTVPSNPKAGQRVSFVVRYTGSAKVTRIDIVINGRTVKSCSDSVCLYTGGPLAARKVNYGANAYDRTGKRIGTSSKILVMAAAKPARVSTIQGRLTGKLQFVGQVIVYNLERSGQSYTARPDSNGRYRISNVPDGRYRVALLGSGKFDVIARPRYRDIRCRGSQTYSANFEVRGVMEG